jgi:hypothetical protein
MRAEERRRSEQRSALTARTECEGDKKQGKTNSLFFTGGLSIDD